MKRRALFAKQTGEADELRTQVRCNASMKSVLVETSKFRTDPRLHPDGVPTLMHHAAADVACAFQILKDTAIISVPNMLECTLSTCVNNKLPLTEEIHPKVYLPPIIMSFGGGFNFGGMISLILVFKSCDLLMFLPVHLLSNPIILHATALTPWGIRAAGTASTPAFGTPSSSGFGASSSAAFGEPFTPLPLAQAASLPLMKLSALHYPTGWNFPPVSTSHGHLHAGGFGAPASQGAAFGAATPSTPAFGGASGGAGLTFGGASAPGFGGFGAGSTPAFGAGSAPAFGASSTPAPGAGFGGASAPAFGATSAPAFGGATPAFGGGATPAPAPAAGMPLFGAQSASAFGAQSASAFGAQSGSAFGTQSAPAFGGENSHLWVLWPLSPTRMLPLVAPEALP